jgi:hypothetical protein
MKIGILNLPAGLWFYCYHQSVLQYSLMQYCYRCCCSSGASILSAIGSPINPPTLECFFSIILKASSQKSQCFFSPKNHNAIIQNFMYFHACGFDDCFQEIFLFSDDDCCDKKFFTYFLLKSFYY